jgi:hypothetical protein
MHRVEQLEREAPCGRQDEVAQPQFGGAYVTVEMPVVVHAAHHLPAESLDRRRVHADNHALALVQLRFPSSRR